MAMSLESPVYSPKHGEPSWISEVRQILEAQTEEGLDRPPYIFTVVKALKSFLPEAYEPQLLSLGPYHRYRDDLYEMERFKVLAVKKFLGVQLEHHVFADIVKQLAGHEARIRARYEKYLKMSGVELLWIMAIDGLFLLQFLHTCDNNDNNRNSVLNVSPRLSFMVDSKGHTKPSYDLLMKDVMMLENQIPINALKRILEVQFTADMNMDKLANMYLRVCKKTSPFKLMVDPEGPITRSALEKRGHLLGFFYSLINPMWHQRQDAASDTATATATAGEGGEDNNGVKQQGCSFRFYIIENRSPKKVFEDLWEHVSQLTIFKQGPLKVVGVIKDVVTKVTPHLTSESSQENSGTEEDVIIQVEEIVIPSVSDLVKTGVEFKPTKGGLSSIKYDTKTQTFELPMVKLDVNSEVIIRNLVAYEAMAIPGPLVLARYTELMNGIVDTEEDVKILKAKGIIKSELKNREVANLWNGMSKSIRVTRVDFIDEAIDNVNKEFNSLRTVKMYRMGKAYIYGSWKMLMLLATLLVIGLMVLQSFCSVYSCPRLFHLEEPKM